MKVLTINIGNTGSTGTIIDNVAHMAAEQNIITVKAFPTVRPEDKLNSRNIIIGNAFIKKIHKGLSYFIGFNGCFSIIPTLSLLRKISKLNPDIIHMHNLHGWYINIPMLFRYIKKHDIKTIWTLHDCWAFTGHCSHFESIGCTKWKTQCRKCELHTHYPKCYLDDSAIMYKLKKKWMTGVKNMTIVTPSQWLGKLAGQSFLKDYKIKTVHNGIDLSIFKPTESDFRKEYACENKTVLLGVASIWGYYKGLDVFIELAKRLDERYIIVLVGTNEMIDAMLPNNIISIHCTSNQHELAKIYSAADLLLNPTREDTFPTVNMESIACGTPVLTFKTGGGPEIINETSGFVSQEKNVDSFEKVITDLSKKTLEAMRPACVERAKKFDVANMCSEYCKLYQ